MHSVCPYHHKNEEEEKVELEGNAQMPDPAKHASFAKEDQDELCISNVEDKSTKGNDRNTRKDEKCKPFSPILCDQVGAAFDFFLLKMVRVRDLSLFFSGVRGFAARPLRSSS